MSKRTSSKSPTVNRRPTHNSHSPVGDSDISMGMNQTMSTTVNGVNHQFPPRCYGCDKLISERFLLKAMDHLWHEDCLKCSCCECRLGEVGSTLYTKANLILCKRDYLRLFGSTGTCSACSKTIPAFEMVMRAKGNNYHLECFACQRCNHRFCVGDKFYLLDNRILCEYDYEDVTSSTKKPSFSSWSTSLEKLKRQTDSIDSGGVSNPPSMTPIGH